MMFFPQTALGLTRCRALLTAAVLVCGLTHAWAQQPPADDDSADFSLTAPAVVAKQVSRSVWYVEGLGALVIDSPTFFNRHRDSSGSAYRPPFLYRSWHGCGDW